MVGAAAGALRLAGLGSNVFFIAYGGLSIAYPVLILHVCLIPLNLWRLREIRQVPAPALGLSIVKVY
jgi:hypothetical protein